MQVHDEKSQEVLLGYVPDNPVVGKHGYTLNMPLGLQDYPGWQAHQPELIQRIYAERDSLGIVIEDDLWNEPVDEPTGSPFDELGED